MAKKFISLSEQYCNGLTFLSTLGTVKEHPDDEIIREFLEAMHDAGRSKQEWMIP